MSVKEQELALVLRELAEVRLELARIEAFASAPSPERDAALIMVELVQGRAAERVSATSATPKTICLDAQRARDPGQKNYKGGK